MLKNFIIVALFIALIASAIIGVIQSDNAAESMRKECYQTFCILHEGHCKDHERNRSGIRSLLDICEANDIELCTDQRGIYHEAPKAMTPEEFKVFIEEVRQYEKTTGLSMATGNPIKPLTPEQAAFNVCRKVVIEILNPHSPARRVKANLISAAKYRARSA